MKKTISGICAVLAAGTALTVGGATPALATVKPRSCPMDTGIDWYNVSSYRINASGTYYKDGPGGTMTVSVTRATTLGWKVTGTYDVSEDFFFGSAKQQISVEVSKSTAVTTGHTYMHTITSNKYGNMQYGSNGFQANWEETQTQPNCSSKVLKAGSAIFPVTSVGWKYWETSS